MKYGALESIAFISYSNVMQVVLERETFVIWQLKFILLKLKDTEIS